MNTGVSGLELIAIERDEQINKHGFSLEKDAKYYEKGELVQAAVYCLGEEGVSWPESWDAEFKEKIDKKTQVQKLIVAGALFRAENDRLGINKYEDDIKDCAIAIESILYNS